MRLLCLVLLIFNPLYTWAISESLIPLEKPSIRPHDKASLQRGAKLYINYCLGCHSLAYLRYNRMSKDIGITDAKGQVYEQLVKDNLIFSGAKLSDPILSAMPAKAATQWFGVKPPDLTLIARIRGIAWIYTYLRSFYVDPKRPLGVNNLVFPDVAMPNVLESLQGIQEPVYKEKIQRFNGTSTKIKVIDHLVLIKNGSMSEQQFDAAVTDLVNFLAYSSAPEKLNREFIGIWVILFLVIFAIVVYLLKREYWRDIK